MESRKGPGSDGLLGEIVVAALTYKRPHDVAELLPKLEAQCRDVDDVASRVSILIVDNDPAGSARSVVEGLGMERVRYVLEQEPGIAAARNRVLDEARGAHLLVFIDDDERPHERWLASLVDCYRRDRPAGVVGAVVVDAGRIDDPWIAAGRFFVRRRFPTGTEQQAAGTGNLLLDLRQVENLGGIRFDTEFGLTGGSDTVFTRTLTGRGGRLVWCDEAVVVDFVPTSRLTREWVIQRQRRVGNGTSRVSLARADGFLERSKVRAALSFEGVVRVVVGTLRMWLGAITGSLRHQARGARAAARGRGVLTGAWGSVHTEYKRQDPVNRSAGSGQPEG